jgi:serine/threonine protein kinase
VPETHAQLGPYEVLEAVGKGGMATVYRGRKQSTGQIVALKVMEAASASNPVMVKRFEQEFRAAARLRHPNIVQGYDFGLENGQPYLVMEYINGPTLGRLIGDRGPLPQDEALRIMRQIADALQSAHDHNLIHRDIKPENILLTADGQAKLADLGLIKDLLGGEQLTGSRTCLGTIAFVAPEQYEDAKRADVRSDIYGLGATLYHALTGVVPFQGRRNLQILRKKILNDFPPPISIVPTLSPVVDAAVRRSLNASPDKRQASCQEFIDSLSDSAASPSAPRVRKDRPGATPTSSQTLLNPQDRRRARRYPTVVGAQCRPLHDQRSHWAAEIQDISSTGVRLHVARRFEPGASLMLEVLDEQAQTVTTLYVIVQWVRAVGSKMWSLGAAFHHELDSSELDTLLGSKPKTMQILHD